MPTNLVRAPFPGYFFEGDKGPVIRAFKSALRRHGYNKIIVNDVFGDLTKQALIEFQIKYRLSGSGNYGTRTHNIIQHWLTPAEVKVYEQHVGVSQNRKEVASRAAYVERLRTAGFKMINNRANVHYTQKNNRMEGVKRRLHLPDYPRWEDCSSSVTWLFYQAGLPDPNGLGFNGYGYTGTLCRNGRVVNRSEAMPGDMVFYGGGAPWGHVGLVITGSGNSAMIFSHGSESGPKYLSMGYRSVGQVRRYF